MRSLSSALRPVMSPAPGCAAAPERPAPAGEAAPRSAESAGGSAAARPVAGIGRAARGNPPAPAPSCSLTLLRSPHDHDEPNQEQQHDQGEGGKILGSAWPLPLGGTPLEILSVARQDLDQIVDSALDPTGHIAGAKPGQDGILDDQAGDRIGQGSFEAIADLDAHLTLVRRNDEQRAVVETFLTDPPVPPEPVAVVGDVVTLQRRQCDHHELGAGLALELFELAVD